VSSSGATNGPPEGATRVLGGQLIDPRHFTVSVVVPVYNKQDAIACTIRSVLRQARQPDELVIVDDGSTDRSIAIVREVINSEKTSVRLRIIEQENRGVSAARNRGAEESGCDYIAFLDADDEWLPDCLSEMQKLATAFEEATVFTVRLAKLGRHGELVPEPSALPPGFFGQVERPVETYQKGYGIISSSSIAVRRDAWQRSGGFPVGARNGEDICWWLKLMMRERVAHSGRPLSIWHDEFSGVDARKGAVPHHICYYLGTVEGRQYLSNPALVKFLGWNLPVQIGGRRLADDKEVVDQLRQLSSALPLRFKCLAIAAAVVPKGLLRAIMAWRKRRRLKSSLAPLRA
jgi:glycosyltransferase involved in cell wall biosynthesis